MNSPMRLAGLQEDCLEIATLAIDTTRASLNPDTGRSVSGTPFALEPWEPLRLRLFLDRSTVEVFANQRACVSDRLYPTRNDSLGAEVYVRGGGASVVALNAWRKKSIFYPS